ncbi:sacsin N-terminal ATP-binding-like domain-containing protein [Chryseobacterium polytrichastri]|uniref:Protein NO VEIN C-terminal domain-containing protein n=1 Tax=Chryseobacterium polytrichastri TaxID=1302687 RepID=A0A1M6VRG7_9FLAO|nr:hypothetical protein [Chryseobacterium polytrichastri]SHK84078.1 hypothetical protein SAMN05444267_1008121 [Chryseobacterium polytrichastri]
MNENLQQQNIHSELEEAREQQRLNIPAKRLLEKLVPIPSNVLDLQRRWFWELLQNASDYNDTVDIILELQENKIIFKHNGNPFRPIDTENLIAPDSGKDSEELKDKDMIGQFGTGFISTHILSAKITVEGVIKSERIQDSYSKFKFDLNRLQYNDKEALKKSIQDSSKELNQNVQTIDYNPKEFNTVFTYDLTIHLDNINPIEIVNKGLEYVTDVLPYTLAFMPKVQSVTIDNQSNDFFQSKSKRFSIKNRTTDAVDVSVVTIGLKENEEPEEINLKIFNEQGTEIIVNIQQGKILPYPKSITKLFCSLPMIGTEDFSFPVVINSKSFIPKNERDGINLSNNDVPNRNIIKNAVVAFSKLITHVSNESVKDCFYLLNCPTIHLKNETDKTWYKTNILDKIKDLLLNAKIVDSYSERILLKDTLFPYIPADEMQKETHLQFLLSFYKSVTGFKPNKTPEEINFLNWYNAIDFSIFTKNKFTVDFLLDEVSKLGDLPTLSTKLSDSTKWLNELIEFTLKYDDNFLDKYSIIPNQLDKFLHRKDEINWDEGIDDSEDGLFKIHLLITGNDYKEILLHKDFEINTTLLKREKSKGNKSIAKVIDDGFSEFSGDRESKSYLTALRLTFKWFNDSGLEIEELKEMFKWFASHRPQLFLETFDDEKRDQAFVIVQSGKLQSLAKLAESNLSDSEINAISNNVNSIKELVQIVGQIGSMEGIMEHARELLEDKLHFDYLKRIGENVELVFKEALLQEGIEAEIIHQGWGSHDFEIRNTKNGQSMFVELKSFANGSTEPFKFAVSQAEKAVKKPSRFAICMIERPVSDGEITPDFIRQNLMYKENITDHLKIALNDNATFDKIRFNPNEVKLFVNLREDVRVMVSKNILTDNHLLFNNLIVNIKTQII